MVEKVKHNCPRCGGVPWDLKVEGKLKCILCGHEYKEGDVAKDKVGPAATVPASKRVKRGGARHVMMSGETK